MRSHGDDDEVKSCYSKRGKCKMESRKSKTKGEKRGVRMMA